jgi:basic membrane protein A
LTITTRSRLLSGIALVGAGAFVLAGCAAAPETNPSSSAPAVAADFLPCMVSDSGGFDDHSFNELGLAGLKAAADELGVDQKSVESSSEDDYAPNIEALLGENCSLIVTVGFLLSSATDTAAAANPDVDFAIVDDGLDNSGAKDDDGNDVGDGKVDVPNGKPILFETDEAAFLAGYAAASYSKTGTVGTFGGIAIPPVTIFMDGFVDGVAYYNQAKGKDVKVVGWDVASQKGTFTGGFAAGTEAKAAAQTLLDAGADVILPVGGPIYQSAAEAIKDAGGDVALIGVDADVYNTDPTVKDLLLTSVMKGVDAGVSAVVKDAAAGKFDNTPYVGTLENGGVGLAPFHDFADKVDPGLQGELDTIKAGIIDGSITVDSPASLK